MIGNVEQVEKAERIKERLNTEFDRLANALSVAAAKQSGEDRSDMECVLVILEEKRAEVLGKTQADYFINNWRQLNDRVRELISQDARYLAMNTRKALRQRTPASRRA